MDFPQDIFKEIISYCEIRRKQVKKVLEVGTYFVENRFNHSTGSGGFVENIELRELFTIKIHRRSKCYVWFSIHKEVEDCPLNTLQVPEGELIKAHINVDPDGFESVPLFYPVNYIKSMIRHNESRVHYSVGHFRSRFRLAPRVRLHPMYKLDAQFTQKTWEKYKNKFTWANQLARILKSNPLPEHMHDQNKIYGLDEIGGAGSAHQDNYLRCFDIQGGIFFRQHQNPIPISVFIEKLETHIEWRKTYVLKDQNPECVPKWDVLQFEYFEKLLDLWRSWE